MNNIAAPELLAPAGSIECLHAAVENGADAVYFGIVGTDKSNAIFNARVRAKSIPLEKLGDTMAWLRGRGIKGYVTLNTLVHSGELPAIERLLREIAETGTDAVLVQDLGVARLARRVVPELPLHASTQMSLTSRRAIELAATLGIRRVVLPRELSLEQIAILRNTVDIELECFVHGALCMSFSGQCYASLGLGDPAASRAVDDHTNNHSANRGRCAQPCRLPYALLDENAQPLRSGRLLSPCDLAALPVLPKLMATGIHALKIEGRLKPPEYVAEATRIYRNAIDGIVSGVTKNFRYDEDIKRLELTFSRGFSTGWLEGIDPRKLVPGNITDHRGSRLGTVVEMRRDAVVVKLCDSVRRGDGVLFDCDEQPEKSQGGRVYEIFRRGESVKEAGAGAKVLLTFANNSLDADFIGVSQVVYKTDDPQFDKEIRRTLTSRLSRPSARCRIPLALSVRAVAGEVLQLEVKTPNGVICALSSEMPLEKAKKHPLTSAMLREQLGRLGETPYSLGTLDGVIDGEPMLPLSVLGKLRRDMVETLNRELRSTESMGGSRNTRVQSVQGQTSSHINPAPQGEMGMPDDLTQHRSPTLHLLLRDIAYFSETSLQKIMDAGCRSFYGEFRKPADYRVAAEQVRKQGGEFVAVLPRILKPGDIGILNKIAKVEPDAVLARNLEEIVHFRQLNATWLNAPMPIIADFSLNAINPFSFQQLFDWGVSRITPGWDFSAATYSAQMHTASIPAEKMEQIVLGRIPLFTAEHCLWRANLVEAGKPCEHICERRSLKLRDRYGALHGVRSDLFCRMIVENATPVESPPLAGYGHFRIEWNERLGDASPEQTVERLSPLVFHRRND